MEDNNFWDELAKRLRQEQAQPFQEDDWAAVHGRLRQQRKRRGVGGWLWPVLAILLFFVNNLVWWQLWKQSAQTREFPMPTFQEDTVLLIRERILRDTVWKYIPSSSGYLPAHSVDQSDSSVKHADQQPQSTAIFRPDTALLTRPAVLPIPAGGAQSSRLAKPVLPLATRWGLSLPSPRLLISPVPSFWNPRPVRDGEVFVEAGVGAGMFVAPGVPDAWVWQYGASAFFLPASWGFVVGARQWHAGENPVQTAAKLGLPDDCENCPAAGYPDRVRLEWVEFQIGPVYRLPWPKGRTKLYVAALGHLRGRADQYRHFYFEQYGPSPPIEVDDRYREKPGLYWNGFSGKLSATHRLANRLALFGALEGRWPAGVNLRLTPPSAGLNLGLAWYFRN